MVMTNEAKELRNRRITALAENRVRIVSEVRRLKDEGMSISEIARRMDRSECSIRVMLDEEVNERMKKSLFNGAIYAWSYHPASPEKSLFLLLARSNDGKIWMNMKLDMDECKELKAALIEYTEEKAEIAFQTSGNVE